jgi:hypothetical protein
MISMESVDMQNLLAGARYAARTDMPASCIGRNAAVGMDVERLVAERMSQRIERRDR